MVNILLLLGSIALPLACVFMSWFAARTAAKFRVFHVVVAAIVTVTFAGWICFLLVNGFGDLTWLGLGIIWLLGMAQLAVFLFGIGAKGARQTD